MNAIRVVEARPDSPHLEGVRTLWRQHSGTLGYLPDGAFADYARRGWVLAADESGGVVGYIAFRLARGRAVIVHLCVDPGHRGRGVARCLFESFRERTRDALGVAVTCRTDFAAAALWPKLGFQPVDERPARREGRELQRWWLDYGHPDLFSSTAPALPVAVLDVNVFFDLQDGAGAGHHESLALRADWIQSAFQLALTPEVLPEIRRAKDPAARRRRRAYASTFPKLTGEPDDVGAALKEVEGVLGPARRPSDDSDHRQLAHAAAGGAAFFVTRDDRLLDAADRLEEILGVRVLRPVTLVLKTDASTRPFLYEPARLCGTWLVARRPRADELDALVRRFQDFERAESNGGLPRVLRDAAAHPHARQSEVVLAHDGQPLGLMTGEELAPGHRRITLLRVAKGALGATLARHLLWRSVTRTADVGPSVVEFQDTHAPRAVEEALEDTGFVRLGDRWVKLNLPGVLPYHDAAARVGGLASMAGLTTDQIRPLEAALEAGWNAGSPAAAVQLERALWPLKLAGADLPSFIVPIRPNWALHLFDERMAAEHLFGANESLLLRLENAYYRAARPAILAAPGRVLWYVSSGRGYSNAKYLCAASSINEVAVGSPKDLYRRFRRFGVFEFREVTALAERRSDVAGGAPVMAFSFSHTAMLRRPLPFTRMRAVLAAEMGGDYSLQSPLRTPASVWCALYAEANSPAAEGRAPVVAAA